MTMFRRLRADEIECRVQSGSEKGVVLLLYKNARCDQNILDETVGPMNWQRAHLRDNANCVVSIWDNEKQQWISKEDTGTESNTEAEKGLASDSFKRACFNWGIGRELYTSPFVFVSAKDCRMIERNGKWSTYDKFRVTKIDYDENGNIVALEIKNDKTSKVVFAYGSAIEVSKDTYKARTATKTTVSKEKKEYMSRCKEMGQDAVVILEQVGWTSEQGPATSEQYAKAHVILDEIQEALSA